MSEPSLPLFEPDAALVQLRRSLRDLKLAERNGGQHFELRGKRVVELSATEGRIDVRIARKLATTPEWDKSQIASHGAQRKFIDDIKRRLERWERED